ncbi:uncharacterized protein B0I36DRAFT_362353 [Microdochium trichocladiopsis]|uniref:Rhodopsin domain-containing protein n=1 Tax=Microdochium trichocladiopsis TaxID=1682393 RepID=A0A9P9BSC8_9PEZI|nr:uncharacterized protein B0I36DRAFT_362353 [Microdochium trichocladiopsis]KAH7033715.1 hypothetical protein B0I36DRAFT_362353 [Microdochium trichocladiopsis]
MAALDPNQAYVPVLKDTGLAIFAVSVAGGILSAITVLLRTWVRVSSAAFGLDDGLMLGGLAIYLADVALACEGARAGLGSPDAELSAKMATDSRMWLIVWMLLYTCGLCMVKSSICVTMLRIAQTMQYFRICVYTLLAITVASWITTFVGVLLLCRPVAANWDANLLATGQAECASMDAMIALAYTSTASTILTDLACAVLPAFLLWRMQMPLRNKILVGILLSFASFASVSTMIRTPYIEYYRTPLDNLPYHIGNIVLWSNIETAIGLIAGSLPSLRLLINRARKGTQSNDISGSNRRPGDNSDLVTFGSTPVAKGASRVRGRSYKSPTETGVSTTTIFAQGEGDWRRLRDSSSGTRVDSDLETDMAKGIRADYSYQVELSERPSGVRGPAAGKE